MNYENRKTKSIYNNQESEDETLIKVKSKASSEIRELSFIDLIVEYSSKLKGSRNDLFDNPKARNAIFNNIKSKSDDVSSVSQILSFVLENYIIKDQAIRNICFISIFEGIKVVYGLHFESIYFENCTFDKLDLWGGSFINCTFIKCKFQGSRLAHCYLRGCIFKECFMFNFKFELTTIKSSEITSNSKLSYFKIIGSVLSLRINDSSISNFEVHRSESNDYFDIENSKISSKFLIKKSEFAIISFISEIKSPKPHVQIKDSEVNFLFINNLDKFDFDIDEITFNSINQIINGKKVANGICIRKGEDGPIQFIKVDFDYWLSSGVSFDEGTPLANLEYARKTFGFYLIISGLVLILTIKHFIKEISGNSALSILGINFDIDIFKATLFSFIPMLTLLIIGTILRNTLNALPHLESDNRLKITSFSWIMTNYVEPHPELGLSDIFYFQELFSSTSSIDKATDDVLQRFKFSRISFTKSLSERLSMLFSSSEAHKVEFRNLLRKFFFRASNLFSFTTSFMLLRPFHIVTSNIIICCSILFIYFLFNKIEFIYRIGFATYFIFILLNWFLYQFLFRGIFSATLHELRRKVMYEIHVFISYAVRSILILLCPFLLTVAILSSQVPYVSDEKKKKKMMIFSTISLLLNWLVSFWFLNLTQKFQQPYIRDDESTE